MFSPLKPTKQKIIMGKMKIIEKETTNFKEWKIKLKIKKIKPNKKIQKIAVG